MSNIPTRGHIYETTKLKNGSLTTEIKKKFSHHVLLLDTTESSLDYTTAHAFDSLNNIGWCKFDDVAECLGEKAAKKVVAHCEKKIKKMAKDLKLGETL